MGLHKVLLQRTTTMPDMTWLGVGGEHSSSKQHEGAANRLVGLEMTRWRHSVSTQAVSNTVRAEGRQYGLETAQRGANQALRIERTRLGWDVNGWTRKSVWRESMLETT